MCKLYDSRKNGLHSEINTALEPFFWSQGEFSEMKISLILSGLLHKMFNQRPENGQNH